MRLLLVTQVIDTEDPVLGFMHRWLLSLAPKFEGIEAICLREGKHALPENVQVHSLGKERGRRSSLIYALHFLKLAWSLRGTYDAVFVHMNQEYLLLAGWLWKLLGKKVYMWRNHYAGSVLTDLAALFCDKVFCTSKHSYTAQYGKTVLMPVGVDTERFFVDAASRTPRSILFLARMAPAKRPELLIDAMALLTERGVEASALLVGSPLARDEAYYASLIKRAEGLPVSLRPGVPHSEAAKLFRSHEIFVNLSPPGMFDKTILEAAACGALPIAVSGDWQELAGKEFGVTASAQSLAARLEALLATPEQERAALRTRLLTKVVPAHSLAALSERIRNEVSCGTV